MYILLKNEIKLNCLSNKKIRDNLIKLELSMKIFWRRTLDKNNTIGIKNILMYQKSWTLMVETKKKTGFGPIWTSWGTIVILKNTQ